MLLNMGGTGFVAMKIMGPLKVAEVAKEDAHDEKEGHPHTPLDAFVVNLNEPGSSRYLKTTVELELSSARAAEELNKSKSAVRDELLRYLSSLSVQETLGEEGKNKIRTELASRADKVLGGGGKVHKLFFSEFVVQ